MTDPVPYSPLTPFLPVRDPATALDFYERAFGFRRAGVTEQDGKIVHAELEHEGRIVAMVALEGIHGDDAKAPASENRSSTMEIQLLVASADETFDRAIDAGAEAGRAPHDTPWGMRYATLTDPEGYRWLIAQVSR